MRLLASSLLYLLGAALATAGPLWREVDGWRTGPADLSRDDQVILNSDGSVLAMRQSTGGGPGELFSFKRGQGWRTLGVTGYPGGMEIGNLYFRRATGIVGGTRSQIVRRDLGTGSESVLESTDFTISAHPSSFNGWISGSGTAVLTITSDSPGADPFRRAITRWGHIADYYSVRGESEFHDVTGISDDGFRVSVQQRRDYTHGGFIVTWKVERETQSGLQFVSLPAGHSPFGSISSDSIIVTGTQDGRRWLVNLLTGQVSQVHIPASVHPRVHEGGVVTYFNQAQERRIITAQGQDLLFAEALPNLGSPALWVERGAGGHLLVESSNGYALLEPVPEPATLTALGLGLLALAKRRRRA